MQKQGQNQRAADDYTRALQYRDDAQGYWRRAQAYQATGQLDPAIRDFDKAISLSPDSGMFIAERGLALNRKGDFDRAIADFDKAISLQANDSVVIQRPRRGVAR